MSVKLWYEMYDDLALSETFDGKLSKLFLSYSIAGFFNVGPTVCVVNV